MGTWVAIAMFCLRGECAFMVSNKQILQSLQECEEMANQYVAVLEASGAELVVPTCIQLKYKVL